MNMKEAQNKYIVDVFEDKTVTLGTACETARNLEVSQKQSVFFLPTVGAFQESHSSSDSSFWSSASSHYQCSTSE